MLRIRPAQRRHGKFLFGMQAERGSARYHHFQGCGRGEQVGDLRRGLYELLKVIEDQQHLFVLQMVPQFVQGGLIVRVGDEVIDGSVSSQLAAARAALTS